MTMKLKILIVEDDDIASIYLTEIVYPFSKELVYATSGLKAIECFKDHQDIDLILMDIKLPDLNGYEVTRQIRNHNKKVVIIAQTAYAFSADRDQAIEAGCNDYVSKPILRVDLLNKINQYIKIAEVN